MLRRLSQGGVGLFTQHLADIRVDGNDAVAGRLHVTRHIKAGAMRFGRQTHHRNDRAMVKDVGNSLGGREVHHGAGFPVGEKVGGLSLSTSSSLLQLGQLGPDIGN